MKIKLPNIDKVHRCPECHSIFNIYYSKFGTYKTGSKTYWLRMQLLRLSPLWCKKCKTLKLPYIWSYSIWKMHNCWKKEGAYKKRGVWYL